MWQLVPSSLNFEERQIDGWFRVDAWHRVGSIEGLDRKIITFGGIKSTILGGEVLVR
jgi:hypothetical protein